MKTSILLAALLGASSLSAQEVRKAVPILPAGAQAKATTQAQDPAQAGATSYEKLLAEFDKAYQDWLAAYREAAKGGREAGSKYLQDNPPPQGEFVTRFQAVAAAAAGKPEEIPPLVWLMNNARDQEVTKACVTKLVTNHVESPELGMVASRLGRMGYVLGKDKCVELLDTLIAKTPHAKIKANALYSRGMARTGRGTTPTDEEKALAKADFLLAKELAADTDPRLASRVDGTIFELENLSIGQVAPDIEGDDTDGVSFKLSDYRGKVVVLDFWGDW